MKQTLLKITSILLFTTSLNSVSAQEYERIWGTYFGPVGTDVTGDYVSQGIILDSQKNMHLKASVFSNSVYAASYYDQFVIAGGGNYITTNQINNGFTTRITPTGTVDYFGYHAYNATTFNQDLELLMAIDNQDNKVYRYMGASASTMNPTTGTWLQTNPQTSLKHMLVKKSPNGSILWATYLPDDTFHANVITDSDGNIYITGSTIQQNISTPGVFQEDFDVIYSQGNIQSNHYLTKLNSNGELIWSTYFPTGIFSMKYYDGALYMITSTNTNPSLNTIATAGAFQTNTSDYSITKINAQNGQRVWGTYYGPSIGTSFCFLYDLSVNETGIYIAGTDYNWNNSHFFATPNAYKTQVAGGSDLFISKFSHNGNRVWSTYFGGNGDDLNTFDKVIDLNGHEIFISGITTGSTDNIATPGSYQSAPQSLASNMTNNFFAKFNSSGDLDWCSYYGGSSTNTPYMKSINVKYDNNSLFLFGNTNSNVGYATEGAFMPYRNPSTTTENTGYIARLNKKSELSIEESNTKKDLILYNNPNNGKFSISGSILQNESCSITIYDMSGKLIVKKNLERKKEQQFDLEGILTSGNYLVQVNNEKGEKLQVFKMTVKK
ncbi:T9SS type A sorting domain-containing protein [Chryseobacterium sp. LC2016-27]|uniref:T9SS type A sorting domain-containing protein n=1 Tax=Chryseobacterium sp. LC2016-27 TaxID=2897326 RepID=UPI001E49CE1F|nr:T9SS type A sorting domain-containing protein [Chryseobacterium sp. LC2016-27]MCD0454387.1 T9SS type A sorting domain-containing protein [Chryseobacterium sp. LC2016-27]